MFPSRTQLKGLTVLVAGLGLLVIGLAAHAQTDAEVGIVKATLHHASQPGGQYAAVTMCDDGAHGDGQAGDGVFGAELPAYPVGSLVHYKLTYELGIPTDDEPPPVQNTQDDLPLDRIVINEFMASNATAVQDPQGDYDDWIELLNVSNEVVDLSGMYLSDSADTPKKWMFPGGTTMAPGGYLIVWADDDTTDQTGLHTNFKLSSGGESILLVDADGMANALIDSVAFGELSPDVSYGRYPDGAGTLLVLSSPTPGEENTSAEQTTDFDGDGTVGFKDFLEFAPHYGEQRGDAGYDPKYDLDGDGAVDFSDFLVFVQHFS